MQQPTIDFAIKSSLILNTEPHQVSSVCFIHLRQGLLLNHRAVPAQP